MHRISTLRIGKKHVINVCVYILCRYIDIHILIYIYSASAHRLPPRQALGATNAWALGHVRDHAQEHFGPKSLAQWRSVRVCALDKVTKTSILDKILVATLSRKGHGNLDHSSTTSSSNTFPKFFENLCKINQKISKIEFWDPLSVKSACFGATKAPRACQEQKTCLG